MEEEEEEGGEKEAMEARNDRDGRKVEEDKDLRADVGGVEGRRRNDGRQDRRTCEARRPAGCCTVYRLNMESWNIWLAPPCEYTRRVFSS